MSQNTKKQTANALKYTPSPSLPKLGSIKTEWDLAKLYYTSEKSKQFSADVAFALKQYQAFIKRWEPKQFTKSATQLAEALDEYQKLVANPRIGGPGRYLSFRLALNSKDVAAKKAKAVLAKQFRPIKRDMLFFHLRIGAIPKNQQKKLLTHKALVPYRYYLERIFLDAVHNLSEAEEKIISLKSSQSYGRWVEAVDTILSNRTVHYKGKDIPIPEALESINLLSPTEKRKLWDKLITEMKELGEFAEHEFNAIITDVRTEDELRGYQKPYSATALAYEDTEESIENLVSVMSTEGFKLSKKFYKLKAEYHGVPQLHYTQKYDPIGKKLHIPYEQAVTICRDVFYGLKTEYGKIFDTMLSNGQIDVYPRAGKRGGAFMSEAVNQPTHVFLNQTDDLTSLRTLAHEMGHAIHGERSKGLPAFYQGHSITTAETASTLFENLLFQKLYEQSSANGKLQLMHDKLAQNTATMQRQIAFFNCELDIHNTIHEQGAMTNADLAACMQKHLKSYLGPAVDVAPEDGYSYVYVPHLRFGFYVYTYCFGLLMSNKMAQNYAEDPNYIESIERFLSLGQSDTVANIFKAIDIDISTPTVFKEALSSYQSDVANFAKLVNAKRK